MIEVPEVLLAGIIGWAIGTTVLWVRAAWTGRYYRDEAHWLRTELFVRVLERQGLLNKEAAKPRDLGNRWGEARYARSTVTGVVSGSDGCLRIEATHALGERR